MSEWTPPPPGDKREQLPDDVLALLPRDSYLSTACQSAKACTNAASLHVAHAPELERWSGLLHQRCRLNNKFTGSLCRCRCHW